MRAGATNVGTLEIEFLTNVVRLQKDMRDAQRAIKTMQDGAVGNIENIRRSFDKAGVSMVNMGSKAKLSANHVQNLSFQLNDMVVGLASGQKPMTVFMQQGAQIGQIMQQAGVGVGGLIRNLGGMAGGFLAAHPAIAAVGIALGGVIAGFKLFQSEVNKSANLDKYIQSFGLTQEEMKKLKKELEETGGVAVTTGDMMKGLWKTISDGLGLAEIFSNIKSFAIDAFKNMVSAGKDWAVGIYALFKGTYDGIVATWRQLPAVMGDFSIQAANATISGIEWMVNKAIDAINELSGLANSVMKSAGIETRFGQIGQVNFGRINNSFAGAGASAADAFSSAYKNALSQANGTIDSFMKSWAANSIQAAKDRIKLKADDILSDRTVKDAKEKVDQFTKDLEAMFARVNKGINDLVRGDPLKRLGIETHSSPLDYLDLRPGAAGSGLTYRETIDNKRDNQKELADAYADEVHRRALDTAQAMADVFGNSLGGVFGKIEQILNGLGTGNFGGGKLGGLLTLLDQYKVNTADAKDQPQMKSLVDIFGKKLDTFFGKEGSLTKVLRSAGIGAGVGAIAFGSSGGALGGAIGGALGKVAGQAIGKAIGGIAGKIGGPLGSIVGGLLGGALGSLLKKAPTGGATITSVNNKPTTFGNNDARKQAAFGAAQSVQSGILGIADQLNGMLGDFKVSIGVYKDKWRVRTDGGTKLGGYVGSAEQNQKMYGLYDFGEDQAGAIKFAIADAIRDGAITGLRAGTATLLKGEGDIERQLQKALDFENVFKELKQQTDPAGAALDDLAQQMTKLRSVFKEANASAADYAALDQLNAIKKQQILDQAAADALDKLNEHRSLEVRLMQAQGDAAGALALQRQMELDGAKAELRPLLQQIYAAEDMADAASKAQDALKQTADKFQQYADALKSYGDGLRAGDLSNPANYRTAQVDFIKYAALARAGDEGGLTGLQGASQTFLDASKANSATALQYQRDLAQVMAAVDQAQRVAAAIAQPTGVAQIAATTTQMSGTLDNIVVTVADSGAATKAEVAQLRAEMQAGMIALAQNTGELARTVRRWDRGDAMAITADADSPLPVDTTP